MGVRRPDWWCYPQRCQNGHEWGPGLITVSWVLCDCPPAQAAREQVGGARRGIWRCSATRRLAAGRCGTGPGASGADRRLAREEFLHALKFGRAGGPPDSQLGRRDRGHRYLLSSS
jgi:hypothetical protein